MPDIIRPVFPLYFRFMGTPAFILLGLFWVSVCLALGFFIRIKGNSKFNQLRIGFVTIFVTYVIGLSILAVAILS